MGKKKRKVQTLIFEKKFFRNRKKVRRWILDNGFILIKFKKQPIEVTRNTFRVRQRMPSRFNKSTFRTNIFVLLKGKNIKLPIGIKAITGILL